MSGEAGAPGTAGDGFRVEKPIGRHRAPPTPPRPDRFTAPIAAAAAILTAASLIALYAPGLAPDATAAGRHGVTVSTAARSARTVSVPLEILPAPTPTIGAEGAWDPETDAPIPVTTRSEPARAPQTWSGVTTVGSAPVTTAANPTERATTTSVPSTGTQPAPTTAQTTRTTVTRTTTTTSPSPTAAASTTSSATPTEEPVTPTSSAEPTPTDVGDVIDEVLGTETP